MSNSIITEPYYRFNDVLERWVSLDSWTYSRQFSLPSPAFKNHSSKVFLVAQGLDTVANITINQRLIASTDNMFRRYIVPVDPSILRENPDGNLITVSFQSACDYANQQALAYPYPVPTDDNVPLQSGEPNRNFVRKEQCSFSWDFAGAFPGQGIWKKIFLVSLAPGSIFITDLIPKIQAKAASASSGRIS